MKIKFQKIVTIVVPALVMKVILEVILMNASKCFWMLSTVDEG